MRTRLLKEEFGDRLELTWRSFLLRPKPETRPLESFRKYTKSWLKVARDEPSGEFQPWQSEEGPPSHSIPPHLAAKAAAEIGGETAFEAIHEALLVAYFKDSRDITSEANLRSIWNDVGLDEADFEKTRNPDFLKQVVDEHNEAVNFGATGAPAFRMAHQDIAVTGAHPMPTLSRWVSRMLAEDL